MLLLLHFTKLEINCNSNTFHIIFLKCCLQEGRETSAASMLLPEMDPREKATLKNCLNCFLEDLDPSLTFLTQMVCSGVITDDQKDRIEVSRLAQNYYIKNIDSIEGMCNNCMIHWSSSTLRKCLHNECNISWFQKCSLEKIPTNPWSLRLGI